MRIKVYGAKAPWCQVPRIIEGLKGKGHLVTDKDYDFVYCNNPPFDRGDEEHKTIPLEEKCFKIFNVLDIPEDKNFDIEKLTNHLRQADIVTCISEYTRSQIFFHTSIDAHIIWNPIKEVYCDSTIKEKPFDFLYVGRANDPNKRFNLLEEVNRISCINVIGNEPPRFGQFQGFKADFELNAFYNLHKIVFLPSKIEGLGLPMLEAMAAGSVPIVCDDNENSSLVPDFCVCKPNAHLIRYHAEKILNNYDYYKNIILDQYTYKIQKKFSKFSIAQNIIDVYREAKGIKL